MSLAIGTDDNDDDGDDDNDDDELMMANWAQITENLQKIDFLQKI